MLLSVPQSSVRSLRTRRSSQPLKCQEVCLTLATISLRENTQLNSHRFYVYIDTVHTITIYKYFFSEGAMFPLCKQYFNARLFKRAAVDCIASFV